jgi:hypothetical protein
VTALARIRTCRLFTDLSRYGLRERKKPLAAVVYVNSPEFFPEIAEIVKMPWADAALERNYASSHYPAAWVSGIPDRANPSTLCHCVRLFF